MPKIEFKVTLENVEMSKAEISRMEKEINGVVASYIVKAASADTPLGLKLKPNPEWLGIWLKKFKTIEDLKINPGFKKYKF